jgi:hypothetical protein
MFVSMFSADGDLVYSTFLGGEGADLARGVAVDGRGRIHVAGYTSSLDYPTTEGAYDRSYGGGDQDAPLSVLEPAGRGVEDLVYSTFFGGPGFELAHGLAADDGGNSYIAGWTDSPEFSPNGPEDVFVARFDPDRTGADSLVYVALVGGSDGADFGIDVAVDRDGNAYVTGHTSSTDFPVTPGAFDTSINGGYDAFVVKLDPNGEVVWSTYIGGSDNEFIQGIDVDRHGRAAITGGTHSADWPTTTGAAYGGDAWSEFLGDDIFVAVMTPNGADLVYSTYVAGSFWECSGMVRFGPDEVLHIGAGTASTDAPVSRRAAQVENAGGFSDAYLVRLYLALD